MKPLSYLGELSVASYDEYSLSFLLCLFPFGKVTRSDDLRHSYRRLVRSQTRDETTHLLLVSFILRVFPRGNQLGKPRRPLKKQDEKYGPRCCPAIRDIASVTAPLVKKKPNALFRCEIGVSAVRPQTRGDEPSVQVFLGEATVSRDLGCRLISLLSRLVVCIHVSQYNYLPGTAE